MFGIGSIADGGFCLPGGGFITLQQIAEALPHGSGIDSDWTAEWLFTKRPRAAFYNSYHAMNENDMYDGWEDFHIEIFVHLTPHYHELKGPLVGKAQILHYPGDIDFKLVGPSARRRSFEGVKDYLHESIGSVLGELGIGMTSRDVIDIQAAPEDCTDAPKRKL